jgi:hypothetical protein
VKYTEEELREQKRINNPLDKPTGHFTGRCLQCGSDKLWDDMTAYGCESCGAMYMTADMPIRIIHNGCGHEEQYDGDGYRACTTCNMREEQDERTDERRDSTEA